MEGKLNILALKREAPCIGVALIKNPRYVQKYNFIQGIPISIWLEWVFASTTPRAASECNSTGFPFCSKDDLCLLACLCHAKQKPYLKEAKIIEKSVVCLLKIKLLHFFHPFASHFPGSSTAPQAAACHE